MAFRSGLTRLVNGRLEVTKASHTFSTPRMSTMLLYPRPCHLQTHWRSFSISAPQLSRLSKRHGRQGQYQRVNESDTICSISAEEEDTLQKFEARRRSARFWLSLGIVVFAVLPGISVWRDQHLEDAARGNGGRGSSFVQSIMRRFQFNDLTGVDPAVDRAILTSVMKHEQAAFLGPAFKALRKLTGAKPGEPPGFVEKNFLDLADWYLNLPPYKQAAIPIIAINSVVFATWNIALLTRSLGLVRFMNRNFTTAPFASRFYTRITSAFSHIGLVHFGFNNYGLFTVGALGIAAATTAKERARPEPYNSQTSIDTGRVQVPLEVDLRPQLFAAFLATAAIGALVSNLSKRARAAAIIMRATRASQSSSTASSASFADKRGRTISDIWEAARLDLRRLTPGSLGSSAGVYGLFALTALADESQSFRLGLIFLPADFSFPMSQGFIALCLVDLFCLVSGLAWADHAAHLGGAIGGVLWYWAGQDIWIYCRRNVAGAVNSTRSHEGNRTSRTP